MHEERVCAFPDPRDDPDFGRYQAVGRKSERRFSQGHEKRQPDRRFHPWTWVISLVFLALWAGLLLDPMVGPLIQGVLMAFGLTLALLLGTMGLGIMGSGLFAAGDHVIGWLRQGARWPEQ